MSEQHVAVVTGANKGIGFSIVKSLCHRFNGIVYLTARNASKGEMAISELNKLGYYPLFHQLDISDEHSVKRFRDYIAANHGGIDILINNAGFQIFRPYKEPLVDVALKTIRANYRNLRDTFKDLVPLLRNDARVINTSSGFGHLSMVPGAKIRAALSKPNLTVDELTRLMDDFIRSIRSGNNIKDGWGDDPYKISKVAIAALTFIQQRELINTNVKVNCINPGYVNTDMTRHMGVLTPDQGAEVAVYVALDAPNSLKGSFVWADKSVIDWTGPFPDK
ncbi:carbonyl reductase [NADPH] 1-like [Arctopsyche grandis]|uniref:carbonyl reductase [NADPH] 1-like n=1 Tax=Arctopsyche grandis TaxID=121162 RepID=UPI00406D7AE1